MPTTAAALALKDKAEFLAGSISSLFAGCEADTGAESRAKILSTLGRIDALRLARTQDEFEAAFDLLATRRFFLEFTKLLSDEHVQELIRKERACVVAGHVPAVKSARAAELGDDLGERFELLQPLLVKAAPKGKPTSSVLEAFAAWIVASGGIRLGTYAPDQWSEWMIGMLWNFGRRALMEIAHEAGVSWEDAIDGLATSRDRRLQGMPFDQAVSDEAAKLLGLQ